jgi:hypothetical protein
MHSENEGETSAYAFTCSHRKSFVSLGLIEWGAADWLSGHTWFLVLNAEAGENSLRIGQVADQFAVWNKPFSHQRWQSRNLIELREPRIFPQINDLHSVSASEVLIAKPFEIAKGSSRFPSGTGNVEVEIPFHICRGCSFPFVGGGRFFGNRFPAIALRRSLCRF